MKEQTIKEFNELSLGFLETDIKNCRQNMINFKNFIDTNERVSSIISETIEGVDYNYRFCFYWRECRERLLILRPIDDRQNIRAMYDYITDIIDKNIDVTILSYWFNNINNKQESLSDFLKWAFKPLIDFINTKLSI